MIKYYKQGVRTIARVNYEGDDIPEGFSEITEQEYREIVLRKFEGRASDISDRVPGSEEALLGKV